MAAKTAKGPSRSAGRGERATLIKLVDNPISYMVLVLLVVESLFGGMALKEGEKGAHTGLLIYTCIGFIAAFVLVVVLLAVWRPEALKGTRRWSENNAYRIADYIYSGVEGYLRNLPDSERDEAWKFLAGLLEEEDSKDAEFKEFCQQIAKEIVKKSKIQGKSVAIQGRKST